MTASTFLILLYLMWPSCLLALSDVSWTTDSATGISYQINSNSALTWYQARGSCQQQDVELLSITELHEQSYISGLTHGLTTALWIGLNSLDVNTGWRWEGGSPYRYLNWLPGNPSEESGVNCAAVNPGQNTKWESKECMQKLGYICKKDNGKPSDASPSGTSDPITCPSSSFPYNGYCYYLVRETKMWMDAMLSCRLEGGDLVSLHNMEEASAITSQLQFGNSEYVWLGLNDLKTQSFFEWCDGSPVTYTTWQRGEPSHLNSSQEDCVALSTKDGQWADQMCEKMFPYICKRKPLTNDDKQATDVNPGCDEGWKRHEDYCYLIGELPGSFAEANSSCNQNGAFLLTVDDGYEQAYLTSLIGFRIEKYFWTGLSNTENRNTFTWANRQEVLYTHWNADMPNRRQGCVAMRTGDKAGLWDVIKCEEKAKYVCKKWAQGAMTPPLPTTTGESACPSNWKSSGQSCVKYFSARNYDVKTWFEARDFCRTIGGDLLSIPDKKDAAAVSEVSNFFWIGLSRSNLEEGFTWSDGSPLNYQRWLFTYPDNKRPTVCVGMYGSFSAWTAFSCDALLGWSCKIKKGAALKEEPKRIEYEFTSDGWLIHNDSQYYIGKEEMPMEKAQEFCKRNFSNLVSINSESEQKFIWKYILNRRAKNMYYIGLRLGMDKEYNRWIDGSPVDFAAWGKNQPEFHDDESCTVMSSQWGDWYDTNCGYTNAFICERTNDTIHATFAPTVPAPEGGCPSGWLSFGRKCYGIFGTEEGEGVPWDDAKRACQSLGGNLVSINDDLLQSFLISNLNNVKVYVWIGLYNKYGALPVWTDQSGIYYTNWAKNRPDYSSPGHCVALQVGHILDNGTWIYQNCSKNRGYICQKHEDPSLPVIPTNPPAFKYGDAFYNFDLTKRTWDDAHRECLKDNSQLASILDEYTTSFLKLHLVKYKEPFWIGLSSSNETKNKYKWVDNWRVRYTKWATEEPRKGGSCVYVDTDGNWKTSACNESYSSICKETNVIAPTDPPEMHGKCPDVPSKEWIPFRNYCYLFETSYTEEGNWVDLLCRLQGARAASVEDSAELDFLLHHTKLLSNREEAFWIGLSRNTYERWLSSDEWIWSDKTPLGFVNWKNVTYEDTDENCVKMDAKKGTWDISKCRTYHGYICKKLKDELPTAKVFEISEEKPSHAMTIGMVVLVMLIVAAIATAVFFVCQRRRNKQQQEYSLANTISCDSSRVAPTHDGNASVEKTE